MERFLSIVFRIHKPMLDPGSYFVCHIVTEEIFDDMA